jgi:DNA-3-methyladenine glycosylase
MQVDPVSPAFHFGPAARMPYRGLRTMAPKPKPQLSAVIDRLSRADLPKSTIALARYLIGKTLVHDTRRGRIAGRIVETEAYLVGDAASHGFRGMTERNRPLFLERGHSYVYFIYGNHFMLNISGNRDGVGEGVLFRAAEPIEGIELMRRNRALPSSARLEDLARGPGRLAEAFAIDRSVDAIDMVDGKSALWLGAAVRKRGALGESVRIGITKEAERVLRFFERNSKFVSGTRKLNA